MRVSRRVGWVLALALSVVAAGPLLADERPPGFEFGVLAGVLQPDAELAGQDHDDLEPTVGLRIGTALTSRWSWFADAVYTDIETRTFAGEARIVTGRTGLDLWLRTRSSNPWFLSGAGGYMESRFDRATDFTSAVASLGFGQSIRLGDRMRCRWELLGERTLARDGLRGEDLTQARFQLGLLWGGGHPRRPTAVAGVPVTSGDRDGDGVRDRRDRCDGTPIGATVDAAGCPSDPDGDGVFEGLDRCPDKPGSVPTGCPPDEDGDGVADADDRCRSTAAGLTVDDTGCPVDADGDGVPDSGDLCPKTPAGVQVSISGCPRDSDGDGVFDGLDRCTGTARGIRVDANGCPVEGTLADEDGDGVPDAIDRCAGTEPGARVDDSGCIRRAGRADLPRVLEGVQFETNSSILTRDSLNLLRRVAEDLRNLGSRLEIGGHTDSSGSDEYNLWLSRRRAEAVRRFLIDQGIEADRLEARGYGESSPIDDNDTPGGRSRNRRVELTPIR